MLRARLALALSFFAVTAGLACGSDESSASSTGCVPGQEAACTCTDGRPGSQRCAATGAAFEACRCTGGGGSAGSGGAAKGGASGSAGKSGSGTGGQSGAGPAGASGAGGTLAAGASGAAGATAGSAGAGGATGDTSGGSAGTTNGGNGGTTNGGNGGTNNGGNAGTNNGGSAGTTNGGSAGSSGTNGGGNAGTSSGGTNGGGNAGTSSGGSAGTSSGGSAGAGGNAGSGGSGPVCGMLPPTFACPASTPPAFVIPTAKACETAEVATFMADCYAAGTASFEACSAHSSDPTECDDCLLAWGDTTRPVSTACRLMVFERLADPACGSALVCADTCENARCPASVCDDITLDANQRTERDRCFAGSTGCNLGGQADPNVKALACLEEPKIASEVKACSPTNLQGIERFLRGACRDGGNWTQISE